ncbi:MAG: hypothetical protein ACXWW2_09225 [Candidatus Deferrimicrobiaceae bacterium]
MGNRWFVAIVLSLAMAASASEASDVSFDFRDAVGGFGIGRESFDRPVDIVRDRDENIYVVDRANNRVQVLDRRGRYLREWGGRGFSPGYVLNLVNIRCILRTRKTTGSSSSTRRASRWGP